MFIIFHCLHLVKCFTTALSEEIVYVSCSSLWDVTGGRLQVGAIQYGQSSLADIEVIQTDLAQAEGLFTGLNGEELGQLLLNQTCQHWMQVQVETFIQNQMVAALE